jgi:hypothetical protein
MDRDRSSAQASTSPAAGLRAEGHLSAAEAGKALRTLGRLLAGSTAEPDLDWEVLAKLASRHGVSPLLFWRLDHAQRQEDRAFGVPAEVSDRLRTDFYAAAAQGMVAERELANVLGMQAEAGVPVLVVKGAALRSFYPDPALRYQGDLDLVVPEAQLGQAAQTLSAMGYRYSKPEAWWLDHMHHLPPMVADDNRIPVELHWRLDPGGEAGHLPMSDLWARAVPWSVDGRPALRLDTVDAALHLCRHAVVQHRVHMGLRPLCDLAQIARGWGPAEWEALVQRAWAYDLVRPVYLMLVLTEELLGLGAPTEVMFALKPPESARLPSNVVERLLEMDAGPVLPVPLGVVQAGVEETRAARMRQFLWHLFLPREGMASVYGVSADSPRIWLTYLWRPVDLLRRYGRSVAAALRGRPAAQAAWTWEAWLERWLREGGQGEQEGGS